MFRILIFGLVAAFAEILGSALVIFKKEWPRKVQEYLLALSAGFLLSLVFFELVPHSFEFLGRNAAIYIVLGFAVLHFFEHTIVGHFHFGEEVHAEVMVSPTAQMAAFSGLFVHAMFDGFSISAAMQYNFSIGVLVFIAILLHKLPEGLTIASIMLAGNKSRQTAFFASLAIGAATMLGIVLVFLLTSIDENIVGIIFAFAAGVITYVGASDLIPEINRSENRITPLIVFVGFLMYYVSRELVHSVVGIG